MVASFFMSTRVAVSEKLVRVKVYQVTTHDKATGAAVHIELVHGRSSIRKAEQGR